jgi:DNA repair exonuclease SbcCD ATPase subunit
MDTTRREELNQFSEFASFYDAADASQVKITQYLNAIEAELALLLRQHGTSSENFSTSSNKFREEHSVASSGQAKLTQLISESNKLAKELQEAEAKQRQQKLKFDSLSDTPKELERQRKQLSEAYDRLKKVLNEAATQVSSMSSGVLRAKVLQESTPRDIFSAFLSLCEQANVKDSHSRCTERAGEVMTSGDKRSWDTLVQNAMDLLKMQVQTAPGSSSQISDVAMKMLQSILFPLTENQAQRIFQSLDATKVGALLAARARDFIEFEYKDGNSYIPFAQASQGQQAAALLDLLLRQEAGTLIIDQPEDDLDNKIIMYVVNLLHGSKLGRQLIFATHNANFVVNGDADKVVALIPGSSSASANGKSARIEIEADGAIETPTVRNVITDTVEGGKEAFDLRGRKYQFI